MAGHDFSALSLPFPATVTITRVDPAFYLTPLLSKPRFSRGSGNKRTKSQKDGRRLISRTRDTTNDQMSIYVRLHSRALHLHV